ISLTMKDIYLALAKEVPNPDGSEELVTNPYKTWKDVNEKLPGIKIKVFGPPPTSGTRDTFEELVMLEGCKKISWLNSLKLKNKKLCSTIREDGAYIESGENDNLIVRKLLSNPDAMGILGFSFVVKNRGRIKALPINGVKPKFNTIANGSYLVSRPLFLYVKKAHIAFFPAIKAYIKEFTSDKAIGSEGYLLKYGLIPLHESELIKYRNNALHVSSLKNI
ncbi:MAG: substrate-binding domain-containing protein, partial [Gammaproteobacteria bacterium]|nr:substrate-binding domain-containing protein [Gammaproteobacteria bacterium]